MTKSLCLSQLLLLCVFTFQLGTFIRAQNNPETLPPFSIPDFETFGNEEWNHEEETGVYEEEEMHFTIAAVAIENPSTSGKAVNCEQQYTIQSGDICDTLATNNGISVDDLNNLNDGLNCDSLQVGQNICVKGTVTDDDGSGDAGGGDGGDKLVSFDQFKAAVTATNGYPEPSEDQYNSFINNYATAGDISSLRELAMFLAEVIWESGGLQYKAELACQQDGCPTEYRSDGDDPTKFYYGRGYMQLTWSYNYKAASEALFGDDRLVTDPDQVANNEDVAWQTAFWFWKANVHPDPGVQNGQFGSATNLINGPLECNPCQGNCSKRNDIYAAVLTAFGDTEQPNYDGC